MGLLGLPRQLSMNHAEVAVPASAHTPQDRYTRELAIGKRLLQESGGKRGSLIIRDAEAISRNLKRR